MTERLLFRTLRGRLMLVAALATPPAFLFVVYVAAKERTAALDRAEADARYIASLASREHAQQVRGAARLLERLASAPPALERTAQLAGMLRPLLDGFPQIANLGILSPTGVLRHSAVAPPLPVAMADNRAFLQAVKSDALVVGDYQLGPIVGRPVLLMARAVRDQQRRVVFVLFAALELAWLDQLAQQASLPPDHALMIVDRNGSVLARSSGESEPSAPRTIASFAAMRAREQGMTRYADGTSAARLGVAAALEGSRDLWVVVGVPEAGVYGMANRIFYRDVAVLALLAIASSVLATDVSLLRDLRLPAHATRRFGEGDFSARLPLPGAKGEICDLARSFNTMADALAAGHEEALKTQEQLRALTHRLLVVREEEAARIAQELRPGVLDRLGLVAGLEWLLNEFGRRSGIATGFSAHGVQEPVPADVSTALFRITQEALTNVARHARASRVAARLEQRDSELALTIADDGRGFDAATAESAPSLGLLGMRERAGRIGGAVSVRSAPGAGTALEVKVNIAASANAAGE